MAIQKVNVGQVGNRVNLQVDANKKDIGNKKPVAKGVGMFKKMWLHITGKAGNRHSQQLTNLRAQIKNKFGDDGLKHLNKVLQNKKFTTSTDIKKDTSTKLLSDSEIKDLMNSVEVENRVSKRADDIRQSLKMKQVIGDPRLFDALHNFLKKEFSTESTNYIKAVLGITGKSPNDVSIEEVINIFDKFIPQDSEMQINIPSDLLDKLKDQMDALKNAMRNGDNDAIDRTKQMVIKGLTEAMKCISAMVEDDALTRAILDNKFKMAVHGVAYSQIKSEVIRQNLKDAGIA